MEPDCRVAFFWLRVESYGCTDVGNVKRIFSDSPTRNTCLFLFFEGRIISLRGHVFFPMQLKNTSVKILVKLRLELGLGAQAAGWPVSSVLYVKIN
jgi:hypothetical protein